MKLSVIIACADAADTIATQLEALRNQSWSEPWEIIIADNGSKDNSFEIINHYKNVLPNVRVVDASDKRGPAYARNRGVKSAKGELLVFCDADDEVGTGWVAAMGEALSIYDFVAGSIDIEKLNAPWTRKRRRYHAQRYGIQKYDYPSYLSHAGGGTIGVKRWLHDSVGGFDESMINLSDTDYCWRIQLKGVELHFVPSAVVHVRLRDNILGIYRQANRFGKYNVYIYKKYLPLGMPRISFKQSAYSWKKLFSSFIKGIPRIRDKGDIAFWAWEFGWQVGRLRGSIQYRVFAL